MAWYNPTFFQWQILPATPLETALWALQILLLVLVLRIGRKSFDAPFPELPISLCLLVLALGWCIRLAYQFVLAAIDFNFFVLDDPARWCLANEWRLDPYLISWDGVWLGGVFYFHGAMMWVIDDLVAASKFMAVLFNLLPLIGSFLFTQSLFHNRWLSCLAVILMAPLWFHILLGGGAMATMPMVGFTLLGSGLLIFAVEANETRRRWLLLVLSGLCLALASTFHHVAWIHLGMILIVLFAFTVSKWGRTASFGWKCFIVFTLICLGYCVIWMVGCWVQFGDPLQSFHYQYQNRVEMGFAGSHLEKFMIYPTALTDSFRPLIPMVVFSLAWVILARRPRQNRLRLTLVTMFLIMIVLVVSAFLSGAPGQPFRTTSILSAGLICLAVGPFTAIWRDHNANRAGGPWRIQRLHLISIILLFCVLVLWGLDNHRKTFQMRYELVKPRTNALALGAWLRAEFAEPADLKMENITLPVWILHEKKTEQIIEELTSYYAAGTPDRVKISTGDSTHVIKDLQPGQIVITNWPLDESRFLKLMDIGIYRIYRTLTSE